jgi:hypothetical protein
MGQQFANIRALCRQIVIHNPTTLRCHQRRNRSCWMSLITSEIGRVQTPGLIVGTVQNEQVNGYPRVAWRRAGERNCPGEGHTGESAIRRAAGPGRCTGCRGRRSRSRREPESGSIPPRHVLRCPRA